jgi:SAM-dependent methyltransferase
MVHALEEIHRTRRPGGLLIDLRPLLERWPVEVAWRDGYQEIGRLTDDPAGITDDESANQAMAEADRRGWFGLEEGDRFSLFYSWDTPREMEEFLREEWGGFASLDEQVIREARSAWAVANADARVRVRASMLINRWRKLDKSK